jgi:hypothetical protein
MSFDEIDTLSARPTDFAAVQRELAMRPRDAVIPIDDRLAFSTSGDQRLFLGDITLRLRGDLTLSRKGTFQFEGTLRSFDDVFDFNPARRGFFGEFSTAVGRLIPGRPFIIAIRGSKPISQAGPIP